MTAELKPCPFCGGEASASGYVKYGKPLKDVFWDGGLPITEAFFCNCIACGVTNIAGQIGHQTREASIAAWNARADLSQAAIAAAMMVAADALRQKYYVVNGGTAADFILQMTPTNATAALKAILAEAEQRGFDRAMKGGA